ncbi:helix-turn-helix domain-containing protein [Paracoccus methylarcula]|uniref:Sigma-54 factor interaction domain-containing protein n=1 Tax=Paracoccus methylarcula TaxID=72022 RepID=A0A422QS68_9RHOB|nr:helix-turn-helix domain-containing protein [Paracoccus methylarcula]RNF32870.1 hypothetical protein A7A09_019950 [Paracoccus methylarcula]
MADPTDNASKKHLIRSSQDRCSYQHGLSKTTTHPILRLQETELTRKRDSFLERIGGIAPEINRAYLIPDRSRYCLLISDADGFVIEAYVPDGYERDFERSGIGLGGLWDERMAGTNGIDMALRSGSVVTVTGPDHFHRCFRDFSCSSVPFRDAQNNIIGTATLVGSASRRQEEITWCEQMLRLASSRFQVRLFRNFHADKMTARLMSRQADGVRLFETIVACDERGHIEANLPLWPDVPVPAEHQNLLEKHLADLKDLTISVRGPVQDVPRRRIRQLIPPMSNSLPRARPSEALASLARQGGGLDLLIERARKVLNHRIPLLVCGEAGVGKVQFVQALLGDLGLISPLALAFDCAQEAGEDRFRIILDQARFHLEYPVERCAASMLLHNVDKLSVSDQGELEVFMQDVEHSCTRQEQPLSRLVLIFTADREWASLRDSGILGDKLLYLIGQTVIDLPPIRTRDLSKVLDILLKEELPDGSSISPRAESKLLEHNWPGNFREMRSVIREVLICSNGHRINLTDLPQRLFETETKGTHCTVNSLRDALDSTDWNVTKAAKLLGKSRATINRWIAAEGLRRPE